ncbi:PIN domain-containing protein [Scytonema sp. UIC 10036]|uniref:PIN domain-containing protein n=1 Tax=Scytonema sp. UIC 10036 TaxID=2304196 RepID=UPI0012DA5AA3|nr:PIN domain-containing protein [Scytonema sp. UIC 10036]MUH01849.1 PIN domain-containing protein [Scytonema sp. UIC 10036]
MTFSIYLDVCCFNRPFDDRAQERIRLETQAFFIILGNCQSEKWQLRVSEALDTELENTPEGRRKEQMRQWAALTKNKITLNEQILSRGQELTEMGFKDYDALHIACAEAGNADLLLTTDDRTLRLTGRLGDLLQVRIRNPLQWIQEVTNGGRLGEIGYK